MRKTALTFEASTGSSNHLFTDKEWSGTNSHYIANEGKPLWLYSKDLGGLAAHFIFRNYSLP